MHAVHVGAGDDDDLVVAQAVETALDVERGMERVELLVFVDDFFREAVGVSDAFDERIVSCVSHACPTTFKIPARDDDDRE